MTQIVLALALALASSAAPRATREARPFQTGDDAQIQHVQWSPDGSTLLSASAYDDTLRMWDVASEKLLWKVDFGFVQDDVEPHDILVSAWSSDGRVVASGSQNGKLQLWEASTGRLVWNVRAHASEVTSIALSSDSTLIATVANSVATESELKVWSRLDGTLVRDMSGLIKDVETVAFVGPRLLRLGTGRGSILDWSIDGNQTIATQQLRCCGRGVNERLRYAYSPALKYAFTSSDESLFVLRTDTGRQIFSTPDPDGTVQPAFSGDERWILVGGEARSRLLDAAGKIVSTEPGVESGTLSGDGRLIAVFRDYGSDGIKIHDARTGKRRYWLVGHPGVIHALAFSKDGRSFASASGDGVVRIWDTQSRTVKRELVGHTADVESLVFSVDSSKLTSTSDREQIVWSTSSGARMSWRRTVDLPEREGNKAISPSGRLALIKEYEKPFRLADGRTGDTIKEFTIIDQLDNLVFCPDEKSFLAKPWWSGWQHWRVTDDKPLREFDIGYSHSNTVAFHPSGKTFITGGSGQNILMFDLESGQTLWSLLPVDRIEFDSKRAQEGRRIASLQRDAEGSRVADIQNEAYRARVTITFDHFGDMTDPGEMKLAESAEPNLSRVVMPEDKSSAIWLRLRNESPLPIEVPTQSMYLGADKCSFTFPGGKCVTGLCDGMEIGIWMGLEDRDGKQLPYGFDFGSSVTVLPGTSVLFAVPRPVLDEARAIRFEVTFQKPNDLGELVDFGAPVLMKFREADISIRR